MANEPHHNDAIRDDDLEEVSGGCMPIEHVEEADSTEDSSSTKVKKTPGIETA